MTVHETGAPAYVCDAPAHEGDKRIPEGFERFEVVGFEAEREQGGTNHVELRKRTGVVWCATCVDVEKLRREHGGIPGRLL